MTRQPLPRLRRRDPLPRLKHLKASSLLRLRKLQARLRDAKGQKKPLPRLRGGHGLPQEMVEALPDVPAGSHLVELTIQGRPIQFWDVSTFPVPADQPMDTDDETPGDAAQGLYGVFPRGCLDVCPVMTHGLEAARSLELFVMFLRKRKGARSLQEQPGCGCFL